MNVRMSLALVFLLLVAGVSVAADIEGTYELPPPEGEDGDTTTLQLKKDDEGNFSAQVTVLGETVAGTDVDVDKGKFSFTTLVKTQIGDMTQTWNGEVEDEKVTVHVVADVGGRSSSVTLKGKLVDGETENEDQDVEQAEAEETSSTDGWRGFP